MCQMMHWCLIRMHVRHLTSCDEECFEDDIISDIVCTCGAGSRGHKKTCPMNSRNLYQSSCSGHCLLPAAAAPTQVDSFTSVPDDTAVEPTTEPPAKKKKLSVSFKPGDYVALHSAMLGKKHLVCRVLQKIGGLY